MPTVRDLLQLTRLPVACAPIFILLLSYTTQEGTGTLTMTLLATTGLLFSLAGFLHNNLEDYHQDAFDPNKQAHPLHDGRAGMIPTLHLSFLLQVLGGGLALYLAWGNAAALTALLVTLMSGHLYNDASFSSFSPLSFLPMVGFTTGLACYGMELAGGISWLLAGYIGVSTWIAGGLGSSLKDLRVDRASMLGVLGARIEEGRFHPGWSWVLFGTLQAFQVWLLHALMGGSGWDQLVFDLLGSILVVSMFALIVGRPHDRQRDLRWTVVHELTAGVALIMVMLPIMQGMLFGGGLVAWWVLGTRATWGTWLVPRT